MPQKSLESLHQELVALAGNAVRSRSREALFLGLQAFLLRYPFVSGAADPWTKGLLEQFVVMAPDQYQMTNTNLNLDGLDSFLRSNAPRSMDIFVARVRSIINDILLSRSELICPTCDDENLGRMLSEPDSRVVLWCPNCGRIQTLEGHEIDRPIRLLYPTAQQLRSS